MGQIKNFLRWSPTVGRQAKDLYLWLFNAAGDPTPRPDGTLSMTVDPRHRQTLKRYAELNSITERTARRNWRRLREAGLAENTVRTLRGPRLIIVIPAAAIETGRIERRQQNAERKSRRESRLNGSAAAASEGGTVLTGQDRNVLCHQDTNVLTGQDTNVLTGQDTNVLTTRKNGLKERPERTSTTTTQATATEPAAAERTVPETAAAVVVVEDDSSRDQEGELDRIYADLGIVGTVKPDRARSLLAVLIERQPEAGFNAADRDRIERMAEGLARADWKRQQPNPNDEPQPFEIRGYVADLLEGLKPSRPTATAKRTGTTAEAERTVPGEVDGIDFDTVAVEGLQAFGCLPTAIPGLIRDYGSKRIVANLIVAKANDLGIGAVINALKAGSNLTGRGYFIDADWNLRTRSGALLDLRFEITRHLTR